MKAPHTVIYDAKNVEKRRFEGIALELKRDGSDILEHNPDIGGGRKDILFYYKLMPGEHVVVYL